MPRQPLTIIEKQQRQLLRKLAKGAGKRIAQQSAIIESRAWEEARQMQRLMDETQERTRRGHDVMPDQRARNLAEAIRSVTSVVRASFGLDQPVHYEYTNGSVYGRILTAKTNLKEIMLQVNLGRFQETDDASVRKNIALLKGATYHEVAHCLWTKDWKTYKFPEGFDLWEYFNAWNLLEDGRIETLLIEKSPVIRNYLLPLVYEVVLSKNQFGWANVVDGAPFLIVRSYLPKGIQLSTLRACHEARRDMSILAQMHNVSTAYQQASGWDDQIPHVIRFHELMKQWNAQNPSGGGQPDPHGDHTQTDDDEGNPEPTFKRVSKPNDTDWDIGEIVAYQAPPEQDEQQDEQQDEASADSNDSAQQSDDADDDTPADGKPANSGEQSNQDDSTSDASKADSPDTGSTGASTGAINESAQRAREEIAEALNDAVTESVTSHELNEVVNQFNKAMSRGLQKTTSILPNDRIVNPAMITLANNITLGMINALDTIVVTPDPSWKYGMDDGAILDLEAFVNRDIGDDSYWVDKDGTGERGHDLSVSLLLDCSGSMAYYLTELGIVSYAIRKACDHFDIPCTTTLFGSDSNILWDTDDEPSLVTLPNMGGTCIGRALLDTPNQRHGKGRHLVVIFTDGEWGDVESLRPFFPNGEVTLLVGFGVPLGDLQRRNADTCVSIGQLIDLPSEVEKSIARFF